VSQPGRPKPRWRGTSHQYAAGVATLAGVALVTASPTPAARLPLAIYAVALVGLFATSALYHRVTWSPAARKRIRCLDHGMIFVLIAGTATPFAVLVLPPPAGTAILAVAWTAALGGLGLQLAWGAASKWLTAVVCVALGWAALATAPVLWSSLGPVAVALLIGGGAVYTAGAAIYVLRRPDPLPAVFGYHEVFHALVIVAAGVHFAVVANWLLPRA
jgi:hemolysin III